MRTRLVLGAVLCLVARAAWSAPIVYLEDLRAIHVEEAASTHGSGYSITIEPDPPFSYFARSRSGGETFASQSSAMNAVQMTASGVSEVYLDIFTNGPVAYSTFHVRFEITEATPFTLSGSIAREEMPSLAPAAADVQLRLSSGGVDLYFLELPVAGTTPLTLPVSASGELAPGVYELFVSAVSDYPDLGRGTYDVAFSIAPEPATGTLLLAGLLGLTGAIKGRA
jgi:hypothetical protein